MVAAPVAVSVAGGSWREVGALGYGSSGSCVVGSQQGSELQGKLKTQLNETLSNLKGEQSKRLTVADNLFQAQKSLDIIHSEILKAAGDTSVIENSGLSSGAETDAKEVMPCSLNQTVTQLQQLFQALNQQLTKGNEHYQIME